ncbi:hypothetical protein V2G26_020606 [Clonostachys chloroleuca]
MDKLKYELALEDEFDAFNIEVKAEEVEEILSSRKYPAKQHARKVAAELARPSTGVPDNGIIFLPGEPSRLYEDSDQGPDFRQRRYFYYITGADFADCAVTYQIPEDRLTLWIPYVEPRQVLWYGSTPDAAKALQLYDVDDVRYTNDLSKFFDLALNPSTTLYILHRSQLPRDIFGQSDGRTVSCRGQPGRIDYSSLQSAMDRARVIKDDYEIALIQKANDISSIAHREVARQLLQLRNEQDIEAIFVATCVANGAHSQAYKIIAGAGVNASTLHYDANNQPLDGKQVVVVDAGCEYKCYASDVTRTLPIPGVFSPESKAIYHIVERMQEECISAIKPGTKFSSLHLHAASVAAQGLLKLGILKGDLRKVEDSGVASAFFPHGLGHHVGLEVHDVSGDLRLLSADKLTRLENGKREMITPPEFVDMRRSERRAATGNVNMYSDGRQVLRPGMIVTVEPGIYFCREYLEGYFLSRPKFAEFIDRDVLEGYYGVGGVRIEDDILVTEKGYRNLTSAPKGDPLLSIMNEGFEVIDSSG